MEQYTRTYSAIATSILRCSIAPCFSSHVVCPLPCRVVIFIFIFIYLSAERPGTSPHDCRRVVVRSEKNKPHATRHHSAAPLVSSPINK